MYLAIVDFTTAPADRQAALDQLRSEQDEVRGFEGCVNYRVFTDPGSDTAVTILHEWDDEASFQAYAGSDAFARSGAVVRPLMTGTPSSRRFRAELDEVVA